MGWFGGEQDKGDEVGGGGKEREEGGETQEGRKKGLEERDSLAQFGYSNISQTFILVSGFRGGKSTPHSDRSHAP